ncbi:Werner Syndrome-like exonuclease [Impatiens glandulifera]|uniref:Werner Syndrome-like exonuclease n=1 Tax=Impatiens glandulifera TaxID=253017 RepID=UPI001FB0D458|nr:Werner Syndrome-like exonuclease [Impatiens glandulifera]
MAMESSIYDHGLPVLTHDLYTVNFYNDSILTCVTQTPSIVENWISKVESIHRRRLNRLIIGLDIEWRPTFGRRPYSPVATIQLCIGHHCLIFQLIHASYIPDSLVEFLDNPYYTFVGVGIKNDVKKLGNDYQLDIEPTIVDLARLAADRYDCDCDFLHAGLKKLASMVLDLDVEKPKRITLSRWDDLYLSDEQVQYACIDAFLSFEIGRVLNAFDF